MPKTVRVGLVGDRNNEITAHRAIPRALALAASGAERAVEARWIPTTEVSSSRLDTCDALWCVPGSPYASMDGALEAIRFARERGVPFLGTCGGFQHALIEYARHVLGMVDADHAESNPGAKTALIAPLACSLLGVGAEVRLTPGSRLRAIYGADSVREEYFCSYGLAPELRGRLDDGKLRVAAVDEEGHVRAVELTTHRFFFASLFQPERSALAGKAHPLIAAFVRTAGGDE